MAARQKQGQDPWNTDCLVTPLIGGDAVMSSMRADLENAISAGGPGHVYIAGWRLNMVRDLSQSDTAWSSPPAALSSGVNDDTAVGLLLRLMQAKPAISVRILVWMPDPGLFSNLAGLQSHYLDHFRHFAILAAENSRLAPGEVSTPDIGVFALDLRTARSRAAAHHQKFMIIRTSTVNVAYCGGVDLAFTRRSGGTPAASGAGPSFSPADWQSGTGMPDPDQWPHDGTTVYDSVSLISSKWKDDTAPGSDLPTSVYGEGPQFWHDQSLRFEGAFVQTLESAFCERWSDAGMIYATDGTGTPGTWRGSAVFSSVNAVVPDTSDVSPSEPGQVFVEGTAPVALPEPAASTVSSTDSSKPTSPYVQLWRTIPYRKARFNVSPLPPFTRGEFTVQAGVSNAIEQSTELIWIFDQYFWSRPLASQINARMGSQQSLYVIVILPPHADTDARWQSRFVHWARSVAIHTLRTGTAAVSARVGVYNLWQHGDAQNGIYCHAKVQTYDDQLLVCGSANINRRSQLCDTEIVAAALDPVLVQAHQQRLLSLLVPNPPSVVWDQSGWGKTIFDAVQASATSASASNVSGSLITDPWDYPAALAAATANQEYTAMLPNGASGTLGSIYSDGSGGWTLGPPAGFDTFYERVMSPTSLPGEYDGSYGAEWPSLDTIVKDLEQYLKRPWEKK
jgi:phosphatidylserine/phosphatidylglycerophosphate/cardiolipin synthase-like enzyme